QRLAEVLVVVVAGQGDDATAPKQKGEKDLVQMLDRFAQPLGPAQLAEQVAGDEEHVHLFLLAEPGDVFDGPAQVGGAVDATQTVAQVPVGGVEDSHGWVYYPTPAAPWGGQQGLPSRFTFRAVHRET